MKNLVAKAQMAGRGESSSINELGELQSTGPECDRLVCLLREQEKNLMRLEFSLGVEKVF